VDPACGTGALLRGAYRWLLRRCADVPPARARALRCLYGVDLDADAVALCARALHRASDGAAALPDVAARLHVADALALDWPARFPDGFDVVLGNPPYISYAGRQAEPIAPARRAALCARYPAAARWPCAHGFFVALAQDLARDVVALVVPDQVAHLARYAPLRAALARTHGLRALRFHGEDAFAGVLTPALSFVAARGYRGPTEVHHAHAAASRVIAVDGPWSPHAVDPLLAKLRVGAVSIADYIVDRGLRTTDAVVQVVAVGAAAPDDLPALEGHCVTPFACAPPTRAVRRAAVRPSLVDDVARWDEVRFVVRQTARHPIVGPRAHTPWFRNSLLGLRAVPGGMDLRYLVGLLNSALLRFAYARAVTESAQRAFPQVKKSYLAALPVRAPKGDPAAAEVVRCVDSLLAAPTRQDLMDALDAAVFALYGLSDDEAARVRTYEPAPR
jgi:hypothetical protein